MFSTSQRQAVIRLIDKKDKDKCFIKNWRPISLLNVDMKIISKAFSSRLKKILPSIISSEQTAYVNKRYIMEGGRFISDIIEMCNIENVKGFIVSMDIEKAFDSLDHSFLLRVLNKIGFGQNFINWVKIILCNQEACVLNSGTTTNYFKLESGARQGDPISPYLFIIVLEILFISIKSNSSIKGIDICDNIFLYTAYADDSTFFLQNLESILELINCFNIFSRYSGLQPNFSKCEFSGIGSLKGVKKAVCGLTCKDLLNDSMKILGINFSYNKRIQMELNFLDTVKQIKRVLSVWNMRSLSLEGRILIFKTLAISKIVYLAMVIDVPNSIVDELKKIQKKFIWKGKAPKIKHSTICRDYCNGGLKNVDISSKIISIQCSWLSKLFDNNFQQWKIVPLYLISKTFGKKFKFHPSLDFEINILKHFPIYYQNIFLLWMKKFSGFSESPSCILSQYIWHNKYIKINNLPIYFNSFSEKNINFVCQFFHSDGKVKTWNEFKHEFNLNEKLFFKWVQITHAIPRSWNQIIKGNQLGWNCKFLDHHLIKSNTIVCIEKLKANTLYLMLIAKLNETPTSQTYFVNKFNDPNLDWKFIYILPRRITLDCYARAFQYKILHNALFLNKKLFIFGKTNTAFCSFCNLFDETIVHLFCECGKTKALWNELKISFASNFQLHDLSPQAAYFGFLQSDNTNTLQNNLLLIFKLHIYKSRKQGYLNLANLMIDIRKVYQTEKTLVNLNRINEKAHNSKWSKIECKLV